MSEIEPINETHSDRSDNNDRRDRSAERAAAAAEAMRTAERARAQSQAKARATQSGLRAYDQMRASAVRDEARAELDALQSAGVQEKTNLGLSMLEQDATTPVVSRAVADAASLPNVTLAQATPTAPG